MEVNAVASRSGALAQGTRIEVIRLLAEQRPPGLAAGEVASRLGQPPSTLSFHLAALEQAGLVRATRRGRQVLYAFHPSGLRELFDFLATTIGGAHGDLLRALERSLPNPCEESTPMQPAFNVLFVCTRNSARSIIAEAVLETVGRGRFNAYSAGTEPAEAPMPEVVDRLGKLGHDAGTLRSKAWTEFTGPDAPRMDFVITLSDSPAGEVCPDLGERPITASWPFPDPALFMGSEVERTALLNGLYGMIRRRLEAFTNLPFASLDRLALKARLDELGNDPRAL